MTPNADLIATVGAVIGAIAVGVGAVIRTIRQETRPRENGKRNGKMAGEQLGDMAVMLAEIQHQTQQNSNDIAQITDIINKRIRVSGTNEALKRLIEWADQKMAEEGHDLEGGK